jgi:hypothetical protein
LKAAGSTLMVFNAYDGIKSDPYLSDKWFRGSIMMLSNTFFTGIEMKYDMLEDNVLVKDISMRHVLPNYACVKSFSYIDIEGHKHTFLNLAASNRKIFGKYSGFYELLYRGDTQLIVKIEKYLKHIASKGAYSSNKSYDEFRARPPEYLLLNNQHEVIEFTRGKKNFLSALKDNDDLSKYAKDNKLNLMDEQEMILLLEYFDSLAI